MKKKTQQSEEKYYDELYLAKIQSSGLTKKDGAELRFRLTLKKDSLKLGLPEGVGFVLPYFDLSGKPTKFFRYRYLEDVRGGFSRLAGVKELRYVQQTDTINEVYLPPLLDWREIAKNTEVDVLITEGELKAAAACKRSVPCMGLGGVWCFMSSKNGMGLLPIFAEVKWRGRNVYITYDSDVQSNPNVMAAENALARQLTKLGANVWIVRLPKPEEGKIGLDDYLLGNTVEDLRKVLNSASCFKQAEMLHQLNSEVVYVKDPGLILRLDNLQRLTPQAFMQHAFSTYTYEETVEQQKGTKVVERKAPQEWIKWKNRAEVERATYLPGQARVVEKCLNVWPGWGVEPRKGGVEPWKNLLNYLFAELADERRWFEQWCAYPLQNPGNKLFSSCLFWGATHGTGKSLVGETLRKIYGQNGCLINDRHLHSDHNEWAENKQFVVGDEITGGGDGKKNVADRMKGMITQDRLRLNIKYIPSYEVPDCINYYFTSNHADAFFLEDKDRRYFIHECGRQPLSHAFYENYDKWLHGDGPAFLFEHLLNLTIDIFHPKREAMRTRSKEEMIRNVKSDLASWVLMIDEDPDTMLRTEEHLLPYKLWKTEDLLYLYDPEGKTRVSLNGMGRALREGGFKRINGGDVVRTLSGNARLWGIRDFKALEKMSCAELGKLYDEERKLPLKPISKRKYA